MWLIYPVLAAACVSSTVAVAPCDPHIVAQLGKIHECYSHGRIPKLLATGVLGTHIRISKGELPNDTRCVTALQHDRQAEVTIYLKNGGNVSFTNKHEPKNAYILETDAKGAKYRLYVIHNEAHVYSYYRCIEGSTGGTGSPMGDVAVGCKFLNNPSSKAVIQKAETCFTKLGINNIVSLTPCKC